MSIGGFLKLFFVFMTATTLFLSCATMTITDVGKLRKGMRMDEVKSILPLASKYNFPVGTTDSEIIIKVSVYIVSSGSYSSNYLLAFRDDQLFYWGYPHEFARSTDTLINEIGQKAVITITGLEKTPK
jgi:hypothetical protein